MRISELAQATGVPVHTLKYYLREGILMPGRPVSRTRADYGEQHVERVRLVRALVEQGGVAIAGVRAILDALDGPPPSRHDLFGVAAGAMPTPSADEPVDPDVLGVVEGLGWKVSPDAPALRSLSAAVRAAGAAGVGLPRGLLRHYAEAMRAVADVDLSVAEETTTPEEALRTVVIGTVMVDPVLVALRRVAQEAVSADRA
ncbi:MAG TPA: MerR family transcriptional regulator [Ornithinibacter sp.]|nr:MerR family transcriptional regulator [Ornithinibacter sp.]